MRTPLDTVAAAKEADCALRRCGSARRRRRIEPPPPHPPHHSHRHASQMARSTRVCVHCKLLTRVLLFGCALRCDRSATRIAAASFPFPFRLPTLRSAAPVLNPTLRRPKVTLSPWLLLSLITRASPSPLCVHRGKDKGRSSQRQRSGRTARLGHCAAMTSATGIRHLRTAAATSNAQRSAAQRAAKMRRMRATDAQWMRSENASTAAAERRQWQRLSPLGV